MRRNLRFSAKLSDVCFRCVHLGDPHVGCQAVPRGQEQRGHRQAGERLAESFKILLKN
jgi:hypothetical protein